VDPLTGLLNRDAWEHALTLTVQRRQGPPNSPVHVAMIDLDEFGAYNLAHGRKGGDDVLREVARLLCSTRPDAVIARWGGEEFAVLLHTGSPVQALTVVEDLRRAVPSGVTASAGVATWDGAEVPLSVLARADAALHAAKRAGRNRSLGAGTGGLRGALRGALRDATAGTAPAAPPARPGA